MKHYELFVHGPLPGLNEIVAAAKQGGRGRSYARLKKKWTNKVAAAALMAKVKPMGACRITCVWIERYARRDPDNIQAGQKFIWDGLVKAGVLKNDGHKQNLGAVHMTLVTKNEPPGVRVVIEPLKEDS